MRLENLSVLKNSNKTWTFYKFAGTKNYFKTANK